MAAPLACSESQMVASTASSNFSQVAPGQQALVQFFQARQLRGAFGIIISVLPSQGQNQVYQPLPEQDTAHHRKGRQCAALNAQHMRQRVERADDAQRQQAHPRPAQAKIQ